MSRYNFGYAIAPLVLLALAACGGGGAEPPKPKATELLVIGNSIAYHPPLAMYNWAGDWGMAASSRDKDFVHLVAKGLNLPARVGTRADIERDPNVPIPDYGVTPTTVVVVELGDNGFPPHYDELLAQANKGASLTCVSTYWGFPETDKAIEAACKKVGGTFVYIGDIYPTRQDVMGPEVHPAVVWHPGDWSMAKIADRILASFN